MAYVAVFVVDGQNRILAIQSPPQTNWNVPLMEKSGSGTPISQARFLLRQLGVPNQPNLILGGKCDPSKRTPDHFCLVSVRDGQPISLPRGTQHRWVTLREFYQLHPESQTWEGLSRMAVPLTAGGIS